MLNNTSNHDELSTDLTVATNKKQPILTQLQIDIIHIVIFAIVTTIICNFGILANIINITIFFRQGFKNVINITFFGIAMSDLGAVISLEWCCICLNPLLHNADVPFVFAEVYYLTGALPHVLFNRVTSFYTAFVTIERCLGVILPLKINRIFTSATTGVTLFTIFVINFLGIMPEYFVTILGWKFYSQRNRQLLGLIFIKDSAATNKTFIFTSILGVLSFVIVIIFTAILVVQLKQKSRWRRSVSHRGEQAAVASSREKTTMKMVIVLASVLIVCNAPGALLTSVTFFLPDFHIMGVYIRLFQGVWAFPLMFQAVNASVNILFYYRMSTRYRQSLHELLPDCILGAEGSNQNHRKYQSSVGTISSH